MLEPITTKIKGGYKVVFGPYTTRALIDIKGQGTLALNASIHLAGKEIAYINGSRSGETGTFYETLSNEGVSKITSLRALAVLVPCVEIAAKKAGINLIKGRTNPEFARFLTQIGWKITDKVITQVDLEKNISKNKPVFRFKIRPAVKRTSKRPKRTTKTRKRKS